MKQFSSILILIVLLLATGGGLYLALQNQETRKGAYFAGTSLLLQPDIITKKVGDQVLVDLYVKTGLLPGSITGESAKVDFVKTRLCFPNMLLQFDIGNTASFVLDSNSFDNLQDLQGAPSMIPEINCLDITVKSNREVALLKSGTVRVGMFKFLAVGDGNGRLFLDKNLTEVSGANPDLKSTDMRLEIEGVTGSSIAIASIGTITPTITPTPTCEPRPACLDEQPPCMIAEPTGGWCPVLTVTPTPITPIICKECPTGFMCYSNGREYRWFVNGYVWQDFSSRSESECAGVPKPEWRGKSKGDANCDGYTDGYDYSVWRREFIDVRSIVSGTNEADFTGPLGTCDGIVDGVDYSLWRREAIDYGGGRTQ